MNKQGQEKKEAVNDGMWGWTSFLHKDFQDPYVVFKDNIAFQLENIIVNIENELLRVNKDYTPEIARKMAICLVVEQILVIQHENAPSTMNAMVVSLFTELPGLKDFRIDFYKKCIEEGKSKAGFWRGIRNFFSKLFNLSHGVRK